MARLQPFVDVVQRQWGHFVREGTPDSSAWNPASREDDTVFAFGQESDAGAVRPATAEVPFATHHTEAAEYTALEVCRTWETHTARSEESSAVTVDVSSTY